MGSLSLTGSSGLKQGKDERGQKAKMIARVEQEGRIDGKANCGWWRVGVWGVGSYAWEHIRFKVAQNILVVAYSKYK